MSDDEGMKIYKEPEFRLPRGRDKVFYCWDADGTLMAEFEGMDNVKKYALKKVKTTENYIEQQVYAAVREKKKFLEYYWSDVNKFPDPMGTCIADSKELQKDPANRKDPQVKEILKKHGYHK